MKLFDRIHRTIDLNGKGGTKNSLADAACRMVSERALGDGDPQVHLRRSSTQLLARVQTAPRLQAFAELIKTAMFVCAQMLSPQQAAVRQIDRRQCNVF